MTERADVVVVGGGVVGLAIARALALSEREVIVAEAEAAIGTGISSRNSEVIHSGIYYTPDSLKARLCVRGKQLLYHYCEQYRVPFKRLGKFIVATEPDELAQLENIGVRARANGVDDLLWFEPAEMRKAEPALRCSAALFSPSTGIIDSHAFMTSLQAEAQAVGAIVALHNRVVGGVVENGRIHLHLGDGATIGCNWIINAAGLDAVKLAQNLEGFPSKCIPQAWLCKGSYFALRHRSPFRHLIYPVPEKAGLGVHLTLDMAGNARFGPDTQWTDHVEYDVEEARALRFYASVRRYWPNLADDALSPAYCGIRPKISGPDDPAADFRIDGPRLHDTPGVINLFGIESPGLTASLAIGESVAKIVNFEGIS